VLATRVNLGMGDSLLGPPGTVSWSSLRPVGRVGRRIEGSVEPLGLAVVGGKLSTVPGVGVGVGGGGGAVTGGGGVLWALG
jgi:hypothetical protein